MHPGPSSPATTDGRVDTDDDPGRCQSGVAASASPPDTRSRATRHDPAAGFGLSHLVHPRVEGSDHRNPPPPPDAPPHESADTPTGEHAPLAHLADIIRNLGGIEPLSRVIAREVNFAHDHLDSIAHLVSEVNRIHDDLTSVLERVERNQLPLSVDSSRDDAHGGKGGRRAGMPDTTASIDSRDPQQIGEIVQHRASLGELTEWAQSHLVPLAVSLGGDLQIVIDEDVRQIPTVAIAGMMLEAVRKAIIQCGVQCAAELRFRIEGGRWIIIEFADRARHTAENVLQQLNVPPGGATVAPGGDAAERVDALPMVHANAAPPRARGGDMSMDNQASERAAGSPDSDSPSFGARKTEEPITLHRHWCRLVRSVAGSTVIYDDADGGLVVLVRYSIFHRSVVNARGRMIGG